MSQINQNKAIRIILAVSIVIIAAYAVYAVVQRYSGAPKQDADQDRRTASASYSDGSSVVDATFDLQNDTVTFTQADVGTVTLPIAVSASGARYANADESVTFWEHQGEATITKDGAEVFRGFSGITEPSTGPAPAPVLGTWVWERTVASDGSTVTPNRADAFTVTFGEDGRVSGTTDCNRFAGSYEQPAGGEIVLSQLASTKMFCADSQEQIFTDALLNAEGSRVSFVSLTLLLKENGGEMIFRKQ